jgi:hypothetical protein
VLGEELPVELAQCMILELELARVGVQRFMGGAHVDQRLAGLQHLGGDFVTIELQGVEDRHEGTRYLRLLERSTPSETDR